jgi:hypothetical protein
MARLFDVIEPKLADWIGRQPMFFVGTAPSGDDGHVNVSPKAPVDTLRILGPRAVAYLDFAGSGIETVSHLRENGRIVIMLCAFTGPPRIVRLHGRGRVVALGDPGFAELAAPFELEPGTLEEKVARSVVLVEVERISDSCGYGVPLMDLVGRRTQLEGWAESRLRNDPDGIRAYVRERNARSIDGLPGLDA